VIASRQGFSATQDGTFAFYVPRGEYAVRVRNPIDFVSGTVQFTAVAADTAQHLDRQA